MIYSSCVCRSQDPRYKKHCFSFPASCYMDSDGLTVEKSHVFNYLTYCRTGKSACSEMPVSLYEFNQTFIEVMHTGVGINATVRGHTLR